MTLIFENLPADRGCLMLRNAEGVLQSRVVKHRDPLQANQAIEISKTIANKVLNDKMAILTTDAQVDPRFSAGESIRFLGIKSAMCVPLFHKKKTIGIIYLDSPTSAAVFAPHQLDLLTALANFAAVGIEQAQLSEKIQQETSVRERLERYHSPSIVNRILKDISAGPANTAEFHLNAEIREVSVLFADIVGFTPMSAKFPPNRVAQLLNEYFSEMTEVIFAYEGPLDKYIGDAIMAIFGAPNTMLDHAYRAVCTALEMLEKLESINARRSEEDRFAVRIGINSGRAVAGDIGSIKRMEYTVLGNTVNLAARIESTACKANQVVVGEPTYALVKDQFVAEPIGPFRLKGISEEANVYRIIRRI
jgi:adenylate cyclase